MIDRARFAAWAVEQGFSRTDLDTLSPPEERTGEYQNLMLQDAWRAWQAAIADERTRTMPAELRDPQGVFDALGPAATKRADVGLVASILATVRKMIRR